MNIKVFAHHRDVYRWRTLIQVGDDWTVRGTVLMKNPGSSKPTFRDIADADLSQLKAIDATEEWFTFSVDQTMGAIVELFKQRVAAQGQEFSGVIQIFNLINTMSPNLREGVNLFLTLEDPIKSTVDADIRCIVAPVYVGWGDFYKNKNVAHLAEKYLTAVDSIADISYQREAGFIHPLYLMRYGAKNPKCMDCRKHFNELG